MVSVKRKATSAPEQGKNTKKPKALSPSRRSSNLVSQEGAAFQRGGASALTPLEWKQLQAKANSDALIEQQTGVQPEGILDSDGEVIEQDPVVNLLSSKTSKRPKKKPLPKQVSTPQTPKLRPWIEGLSFKRISPGLIVLGYVVKISRQDITLALPNNLMGYVPASRISETLNRKLMTLDDADDEEDKDFQNDSNTIRLADYIQIGQYLRARVMSCENPVTLVTSSKRHIELSILPRDVNNGLTAADMAMNSTLQAEVLSVEDHGLILDHGLNDGQPTAFMPSTEFGALIDPAIIKPGTVFLCMVSNTSSSGKTLKLSADQDRFGNVAKGGFMKTVSNIDTLLPGTAIEFLVSETTANGLRGTMMDLVDVTSDLFHSGQLMQDDPISERFPAGTRLKARIIYTNPESDHRKVGVSILEHIMRFSQPHPTGLDDGTLPTEAIAVSTIINGLKIERVEPDIGLLMNVGLHGLHGFAHISRIADEKIHSLNANTGSFRIGSSHRGRVVAYNAIDGLFVISLEQKVLNLPFLSLEDVQLGQVVKALVERVIMDDDNIRGVIVNVTDSISGFIPLVHLSDATLQFPERKFKKGTKVTVRVLSVDLERRRLRLTCKKTLVNSKSLILVSFRELRLGMQSLGTIISLFPSGALVEFYGQLKGFLPVSEMSEAFIKDPREHFRVGQVVDLRVVSLDPAKERITVSCRRDLTEEDPQEEQWSKLFIGETVQGIVTEKLSSDLVLAIREAGIKAVLPFGHLLDGSDQKILDSAKRIRTGQVLQDLVVLGVKRNQRHVKVTRKPSLIKALESGKLPKSFSEILPGSHVTGSIKNINSSGVFVQFAGGLTGLLPRSQLSKDVISLVDFGMRQHQTVSCRILTVDHEQQRFFLTLGNKDSVDSSKLLFQSPQNQDSGVDTVDGTSLSVDELVLGKLVRGRVVAVKESQLNMQLGDGVFGRVDVSEVFDTWGDIKDRKHPLNSFKTGQVLEVRIIGIHDSRNHRFLPITHRQKTPVFELSAKKGDNGKVKPQHLTLDKLNIGSSWLCFVNNLVGDFLWVNLSPNVRGRIHILNISDNPLIMSNVTKNYPVGSAVRAQVVGLDLEKNHLDLSARPQGKSMPKCLEDLNVGDVLPGRVTKVTNWLVTVQLSDSVMAPLHITDMEDDYSKTNLLSFQKGQFLAVSVCNLDSKSKEATLSTRPSRLTNLSDNVADPEITSISQLHVNDVVRGFIKNITGSGLFITLSTDLTAYIRVSDLSDKFVKDWQANFELKQLVRGRIVVIESDMHRVRLSLKDSVLDPNYVTPLTFSDLFVGQLLDGKVRKAEDFGVFVVFDNSDNVSGLCHRTEIADEHIGSAREILGTGDSVRVKVLKIEKDTRRVSLGMRSSYFMDMEPVPDDHSLSEQTRTGELRDMHQGDVFAVDTQTQATSSSSLSKGHASLWPDELAELPSKAVEVTDHDELNAGSFDWTGGLLEMSGSNKPTFNSNDQNKAKAKRDNRALADRDLTGDLDFHGAQSGSDFERLLLSQPNSSYLWLGYMAFHLQQNEIDSARQIAERALRTVNNHSRDAEDETLNIWVGYLNLEDACGDDESIEDVFQRACQRNDPKEIFGRLASIYIQSGKHEVMNSFPVAIYVVS